MSTSLLISQDSRYKDTGVFSSAQGPVFGLFVAPVEFSPQRPGVVFHTVASHEIGFIDLLSVRYYGPGRERWWWAVALANNILDPERDMYVGQVLTIPSKNDMLSFVSRATDE